jgi:hypothetical protein
MAIRWASAGALAFIVSLTTIASANDPAAAQALFEQAEKLMQEKRFGEACPKLEESQRLDPAGGTLLHLAACREGEGKTATAWALFQDALLAAKRDNRKDRARFAQSHLDTLTPKLRRLRLKVAAKNKTLTGFKLVRDDNAIGPATWGEAVPVDPGSHTLTASADGYKKWSTTFDVSNASGESVVDVPELEAEPHAATEPSETHEKPKPTAIEENTNGDTQRTIGLVVGGIGVAGLVVGGIFGGLAFSKKSAADADCPGDNHRACTPQGKQESDDSTAFGNVSTAAFIAGGALALGGAVLYFTAPDHGKVGWSVAPGLGSLTVHGVF